MIFWRAFCLWRTRRVLHAVERWLAWAPQSGMIMMRRFCQWRTERLMNAANRWLCRSEQARIRRPA